MLLRYSGIRKKEITALEISDINLDKKIININKAVLFIHNKARVKTTKNKKSRNIPILDIVYDIYTHLDLEKENTLNSLNDYLK